MALLRAVSTFATEAGGHPQVIHVGELYEDDEPVVLANPSCFEPVRASFPRVEQATAAPGERRDVRRPR